MPRFVARLLRNGFCGVWDHKLSRFHIREEFGFVETQVEAEGEAARLQAEYEQEQFEKFQAHGIDYRKTKELANHFAKEHNKWAKKEKRTKAGVAYDPLRGWLVRLLEDIER